MSAEPEHRARESYPPPNEVVPRDIADHVVILNASERLPRVVAELEHGTRGAPLDLVIIVQDWRAWHQRRKKWWPDITSYPGRVYISPPPVRPDCPGAGFDIHFARLKHARAVVVLADPLKGRLADAHTIMAALAIEHESREVFTVVELTSSINRGHLKSTSVDAVVCSGELTENLLAQSCFSPGVMRVFENLMSAQAGTGQLFTEALPAGLVGCTYRQLVNAMFDVAETDPAPFILCGFVRPSAEKGALDDIVVNPGNLTRNRGLTGFSREYDKDTVLALGDRLILIGYDFEKARRYLDQIVVER